MHKLLYEAAYEIGITPLPFPVKRVYWVYQVPAQAIRGAHAHRQCQEYIVLVQGRLQVTIKDRQGQQREQVLSRRGEGIYLPPWVWKTLCYGVDTVVMVLASECYDPLDYVYKEEFDAFCLQV